MDSFNSSLGRPRGNNNTSQSSQQQNTTLGSFPQQRPQAGVPSHWNWGESPWVPLFAGAPVGQARQQITGSANFQTSYQDYRSKPVLSETETCPEDSAYGSRITRSIGNLSAYGEEADVDFQNLHSQNPEAQLVGRNLQSLQLQCEATTDEPQVPPWNRPRHPASIATAPVSGDRKWGCNQCIKQCRTRSELRKHQLKHTLPWECDVTGCPRLKGFTSKNDLDRHKRTVHGDSSVAGRTFVCNIGACANKSKLWPRADNFRSHLSRIHGKRYRAEDDLAEYAHQSPPLQDLEGIGGAYMQAQDQSYGFSHPSGLIISPSFRGQLGEDSRRRALHPQSASNGLSQSSGSASFDRDASGLAPVQEGDEIFIQPDMLSGTSHGQLHSTQTIGDLPFPSSQWQLSPSQEHDISTGNRAFSESDSQDDGHPPAMEDIPFNENPDVEMPNEQGSSTDDLGPRQSDIRMVDADETRATLSQDQSATDLSNLSRESMLKILDKIPGDLLKTYIKNHPQGHKLENPERDAAANKSQTQTKHSKRHTKPYGCTSRNCKKAFGSKNDWKRHESIQHYQLETWTCDHIKPGSEVCGKICHRRESFKNHVTKEHSILDPKRLEEKLDSCRNGRHCDAHFWCGFCLKIIETPEADNTWAKRFDHIDDHFSGRNGLEQQDISRWQHEDAQDKGTSGPRGPASQSSPDSSSPDSESVHGSVPHDNLGSTSAKEGRKQPRPVETYMWKCHEDDQL
ncbi:hypothetical protein FZEAL_830 [Fusarium zealandicum]|uniref:C2H2-type domain-containing protein n=1 Tax=Fusarium zealandicum TaxID=1053134 RepID=A0A8H4UTZ5_9HYPO|nr:hypothetical protein FZEAL_830 [Fusarium zealandicum]